jgi:hypothetical protein
MIRDSNDEINRLMREKHMWEVQIRNLWQSELYAWGWEGL